MTSGPPETADEERLFLDWLRDTVRAIVEVADRDEEGRAPIHLIFYDRQDQRLILEGLSRHFSTLTGATALYDFLTQIAAFDSPVVTFLSEEIREMKNYPMVSQSLQAVAEHLGFDWSSPANYHEVFRGRMFDF